MHNNDNNWPHPRFGDSSRKTSRPGRLSAFTCVQISEGENYPTDRRACWRCYASAYMSVLSLNLRFHTRSGRAINFVKFWGWVVVLSCCIIHCCPCGWIWTSLGVYQLKLVKRELSICLVEYWGQSRRTWGDQGKAYLFLLSTVLNKQMGWSQVNFINEGYNYTPLSNFDSRQLSFLTSLRRCS